VKAAGPWGMEVARTGGDVGPAGPRAGGAVTGAASGTICGVGVLSAALLLLAIKAGSGPVRVLVGLGMAMPMVTEGRPMGIGGVKTASSPAVIVLVLRGAGASLPS